MVSSICRAKDPSTCYYHGAVINMYDAQRRGNWDEYFAARQRVEEAERRGWEEEVSNFAQNGSQGFPAVPEQAQQPSQQQGQVPQRRPWFKDELEVNGVRYHRRRKDVFARRPEHLRIQVVRPLDEAEMEKLQGILKAHFRAKTHNGSLMNFTADSPSSFTAELSFGAIQQEDLDAKIHEFESSLRSTVEEGTPVRTTNKSGAGTKGTRKFDGFQENLKVQLYYDSVVKTTPEGNV